MAVEIRKGTADDIEEFITLMTEIRNAMEQKDWFYLDPPAVFRRWMAEGIMEMWVAVDGSRMAAAFSMRYPGLEEYNYGYDLGYDMDQLMKVVNMEYAAVHSDYRGQGLQRRLLLTAEQELQGKGERYLLCTIHPENRFSLNNALQQGYEIQKTQEKYGSVRHLLCKKIF